MLLIAVSYRRCGRNSRAKMYTVINSLSAVHAYLITLHLAGSILSVESNQNVESKTKNVESKIAFGQLILRKIIKPVATRCQILRLKCTKI